jgi:hypothetical protein
MGERKSFHQEREIIMRRPTLGALSLAALAGLFGLSAIAAKAETVVATYTGISPTFPSPLDVVSLDGTNLSTGIGANQWSGSPSNPAPFNGTFSTYSIDLEDEIQTTDTYTFATAGLSNAPQNSAYPGFNGPMGAARASEIDELYAQDYSNSLTDTNHMTAFQLAVWNIVYDTDESVSLGAGSFYAVSGADNNPTAIGLANNYLTTLTSSPTTSEIFGLIGQPIGTDPGGAGAQDQVVIDPDGVPEPGSLGLLALGSAVVALRRRRGAGRVRPS